VFWDPSMIWPSSMGLCHTGRKRMEAYILLVSVRPSSWLAKPYASPGFILDFSSKPLHLPMDPWLFLIQFGFYQQNKKVIKLVFLKKKNQNRFSSVILEQKPVFSGLAQFFSSFARFFWFNSNFFVCVWFGFFGFRIIKSKSNHFLFFKNSNRFNRFFSQLDFFGYFFLVFSV